MNSEGVMVTEDVTEMKETNLLNDEKKVQKRIAAEDENTTEENDALPEGEVSKKISDEDKIEDTEENLNDALKITSSEDDVGVESEENQNLGETFGSGEEKRNTNEDIEGGGYYLGLRSTLKIRKWGRLAKKEAPKKLKKILTTWEEDWLKLSTKWQTS
ncbi:hypothetical protein MTP99_003044 [Tenebrio molitor]|nr:hypothetical protein MTP99_003044 [Tenebrio molitor]